MSIIEGRGNWKEMYINNCEFMQCIFNRVLSLFIEKKTIGDNSTNKISHRLYLIHGCNICHDDLCLVCLPTFVSHYFPESSSVYFPADKYTSTHPTSNDARQMLTICFLILGSLHQRETSHNMKRGIFRRIPWDLRK